MKDVTKIVPAPGYCLIKPKEEAKQTASGIYLTESLKPDAPQVGIILSVGAAELTQSGYMTTFWGNVDDTVIFKKWGGNEVKIDRKPYLFVKFEDILGMSTEKEVI